MGTDFGKFAVWLMFAWEFGLQTLAVVAKRDFVPGRVTFTRQLKGGVISLLNPKSAVEHGFLFVNLYLEKGVNNSHILTNSV